MKRFTITLCAASVLFFYSCNDNNTEDKTTDKDTSATKVNADTSAKPTEQSMAPPDSATMMKAMQDYTTPGSVHAMLAKSNGVWDEEIKQWQDPNKPPTVERATATNTMILGGRYQESICKGVMMGQPFEGRGVVGYDNAKKMLVSTWVDNMGTGITYLQGTWDSTTHVANLNGRGGLCCKRVNPIVGKDVDIKETFTMMDDDHQKMEMFRMMGGKEMKMIEIDFTRKK